MEKRVSKGGSQLLFNEFRILSELASARGFPAALELGYCGTVQCLVMDLLGPNLADLLQLCGGRFSLKTTLVIAIQVLDRLETLHNVCGHVYRCVQVYRYCNFIELLFDVSLLSLCRKIFLSIFRDIKPENFLIRENQGIDFMTDKTDIYFENILSNIQPPIHIL